MTRASVACPSCGAPVEFVSAASVQSVCRYCSSVVVRTDLDLTAVGKVSQVPPTVSPIQIGTRGVFNDRHFEVVGRLVYAYERGRWNEWHLAFDDGGTAWLSDAMAEYAVTEQAEPQELPAESELRPGLVVQAAGANMTVSTVTTASYQGTEGELPFVRWEPGEMRFADLRTEGDTFGTIDYSEDPPLLFIGQWMDFDRLMLSNLRDPEAMKAAAVTANCPSCGGGVVVREADRTVNVVCAQCSSVLDARTPALTVLQTFQVRIKNSPAIPLGAVGSLRGEVWDMIGFQVRSIRVEGVDYAWDEYLLYSPTRGFAYLTQYQGHWNLGTTLRAVPRVSNAARPVANLNGQVFRHFQRAQAETNFVLGEFPWQVRVGDRVMASDFVAPPRMLSAEETAEETTWTLSEYVPGDEVWAGFGLEGKPFPARGVYANQPAPPNSGSGGMWAAAMLLILLLLGGLVLRFATGGHEVAMRRFTYLPLKADQSQQVIGPLVMEGRTSSVMVEVETDLDNAWADFDFSLADSAGQATQFGKEISYYQGVDQGESWSEGSREGSVRIPSVPAGRYWLRVEPQSDRAFDYSVRVRRDPPLGWMYLVAVLLLLMPPLLRSVRGGVFEAQRWAESDYAPSSDD
jgi:hypothetical protein